MLMMGECMEIDPAKRGKRSEELELLAGTECPIPSRHPRLRSESLPTLCSQDAEPLVCTLCIGNEAASGKAAMCGYVTSRPTVSLES